MAINLRFTGVPLRLPKGNLSFTVYHSTLRFTEINLRRTGVILRFTKIHIKLRGVILRYTEAI